jgi:hypothetical protein
MEMKPALISLEETEMTTVEMIAEQGRKAGALENDIQSLKMFIPARPRPSFWQPDTPALH